MQNTTSFGLGLECGWLVAGCLKHSTANQKVAGPSPTIAIGGFLSLLGVDSALPPKMSRCVLEGVSPEIVPPHILWRGCKAVSPGGPSSIA